MTGQMSTSDPSRYCFAKGIRYGLMHAVATLYFLLMFSPFMMSLSVIVGWSRE